MSDWKPQRQTDEGYLDYLREKKCDVCPNPGEPHHLDSRGSGGSDYTCIILCRRHHTEIHKIGRKAFGQKYKINCYRQALRHLRRYIADTPIMK